MRISYCDKFSTSIICMPCIVLLHNFGAERYREYIPERSICQLLSCRCRSVLSVQAQGWVLLLPAPSFGISEWHCAHTQHQLKGASTWLSLCGTWNGEQCGNHQMLLREWFGSQQGCQNLYSLVNHAWVQSYFKNFCRMHYSILALDGWVSLISHLQFLRLKNNNNNNNNKKIGSWFFFCSFLKIQ